MHYVNTVILIDLFDPKFFPSGPLLDTNTFPQENLAHVFSCPSFMNRLRLFCPISRAVRVQRPVTCYRFLLNKSFSTTTCRKFGTTSIRKKEVEEEENPPPPPAETDLDQNDISLRELLDKTKSFTNSFLLTLSLATTFSDSIHETETESIPFPTSDMDMDVVRNDPNLRALLSNESYMPIKLFIDVSLFFLSSYDLS